MRQPKGRRQGHEVSRLLRLLGLKRRVNRCHERFFRDRCLIGARELWRQRLRQHRPITLPHFGDWASAVLEHRCRASDVALPYLKNALLPAHQGKDNRTVLPNEQQIPGAHAKRWCSWDLKRVRSDCSAQQRDYEMIDRTIVSLNYFQVGERKVCDDIALKLISRGGRGRGADKYVLRLVGEVIKILGNKRNCGCAR